MPMRSSTEIVVKYVLFDLAHPDIGVAQTDLRQVLRRVGDRLELSVNRNFTNTQAIVKAAYGLADAGLVAGWFANRTWKDAVLQIRTWEERELVSEFTAQDAWTGGPTQY